MLQLEVSITITGKPIKSQLVMDIALRSSTLQTLPSAVFLLSAAHYPQYKDFEMNVGCLPVSMEALPQAPYTNASQASSVLLSPLIFAPNKCAVYSLSFSLMKTHLMLYEY